MIVINDKKELTWIDIELPKGMDNTILKELRTWLWDNHIHAMPLTSGSGGPNSIYGVYERVHADKIEVWLREHDNDETFQITFTRT